ncbi:hypothetical protein BLNAU_3551 [Blattamonas nauphoetae]|uniref:Right handed beta helix domain-containing protein n=1 Tax=Blattamonas nauphoetae TaxID=2049346 RepID=A0ABQ9YCK1_9EUKA|nr:hypothetical protein BLNAU_3551 [Blattamonas nauphoetae]
MTRLITHPAIYLVVPHASDQSSIIEQLTFILNSSVNCVNLKAQDHKRRPCLADLTTFSEFESLIADFLNSTPLFPDDHTIVFTTLQKPGLQFFPPVLNPKIIPARHARILSDSHWLVVDNLSSLIGFSQPGDTILLPNGTYRCSFDLWRSERIQWTLYSMTEERKADMLQTEDNDEVLPETEHKQKRRGRNTKATSEKRAMSSLSSPTDTPVPDRMNATEQVSIGVVSDSPSLSPPALSVGGSAESHWNDVKSGTKGKDNGTIERITIIGLRGQRQQQGGEVLIVNSATDRCFLDCFGECVLGGLRLVQMGGHEGCVCVRKGRTLIFGCHFEVVTSGITLRPNTSVYIANSTIRGCGWSGVDIANGATCVMVNSLICDCGTNGISASDSTHPSTILTQPEGGIAARVGQLPISLKLISTTLLQNTPTGLTIHSPSPSQNDLHSQLSLSLRDSSVPQAVLLVTPTASLPLQLTSLLSDPD